MLSEASCKKLSGKGAGAKRRQQRSATRQYQELQREVAAARATAPSLTVEAVQAVLDAFRQGGELLKACKQLLPGARSRVGLRRAVVQCMGLIAGMHGAGPHSTVAKQSAALHDRSVPSHDSTQQPTCSACPFPFSCTARCRPVGAAGFKGMAHGAAAGGGCAGVP